MMKRCYLPIKYNPISYRKQYTFDKYLTN